MPPQALFATGIRKSLPPRTNGLTPPRPFATSRIRTPTALKKACGSRWSGCAESTSSATDMRLCVIALGLCTPISVNLYKRRFHRFNTSGVSRPNQQPFEVALELTDRPMDLSSHSWHGLLARAWRSDLFQKIVQTYATQVVNIIVTLATTILVTRSLGPQGRGTYAVAITIGNLGVQLSHMGLHASNTYYVAKNRGLLSALLGNALFVSFGLSGALAVLAGVFFSLNPQMAPVHGLSLVFGLAWIPFGLALMLSENLLLGIHEVRAFNFLESLNRILGLALAGILVFVGMRQVGWFLGASFAALVLSFGAALWSVSRFVENWPVPNLRLLLSNFAVGFKAYVIVLLSFLVLRIDLLMVKYLLGAEQAGYYSVAASMADVCLVLPMAVSTILFPRLSGMIDLRERLVLTRKAALGIALALCPLLLVAGLLAPPTV